MTYFFKTKTYKSKDNKYEIGVYLSRMVDVEIYVKHF